MSGWSIWSKTRLVQIIFLLRQWKRLLFAIAIWKYMCLLEDGCLSGACTSVMLIMDKDRSEN